MSLKPARPSRAAIKPRVDHVLNETRKHQGLPQLHEPLNDGAGLEDDLDFGPNIKRALALPYSGISTDYVGGIPVKLNDAGACDTVGDAVNLVHIKANGGGGGAKGKAAAKQPVKKGKKKEH